MILIDKSKDQQEIVLTLSELTTIESPKYLLVIKNDAMRDVTRFFLPANVSNHIDRYDLFIVSTITFKDLVSGYYTYHIYQQTSEADEVLGNLLEAGKLLVQGEKNTVEVISPKRDNGYRVYDLNAK